MTYKIIDFDTKSSFSTSLLATSIAIINLAHITRSLV